MSKKSKKGRAFRGITLSALIDYKTGNLAAFLLGIFYLLFPWLTSGVLDQTMTIFALMFLTISVMRAKGTNSVLGGLCQAFIGVIYIFALAGVMPSSMLWLLSLILAGLFFIMEFGLFEIGPVTKAADSFQIVPFTIMTFALLVSILGYSTLFVVNWSNMLVALNYVAVFLFCALSMLQLAGWNIAGKHTNTYLMVFAIAAIALAVLGAYQGTLFQWR